MSTNQRQNIAITLPPSRLVGGDLYKPIKTDRNGRPLLDRQNKPTQKFRPNFAIPKGAERPSLQLGAALAAAGHTVQSLAAQGWTEQALIQQGHATYKPAWANTEWGAKMWDEGLAGFPGGNGQLPIALTRQDFAWKIVDGDSTIPDQGGKRPCDREGYPGHWIVRGSTTLPIRKYVLENGKTRQLLDPVEPQPGQPAPQQPDIIIKRGYCVQAAITVVANGDLGKPGLYVNPNMVCLLGYMPEIMGGPDPDAAGFGQGAMLPGVSSMPAGGFQPPGAMQPPGAPAMPGAAPAFPQVAVPGGMPAPQPPMSAAAFPGPPGAPPAGPAPATMLPPPTIVQPHTAILQPGVPGAAPQPTMHAPVPSVPMGAPVPGQAPMPVWQAPAPPAPAPIAAPPAGPQMTPAAQGRTYAQFQQAGWSDAQMRAAGFLV